MVTAPGPGAGETPARPGACIRLKGQGCRNRFSLVTKAVRLGTTPTEVMRGRRLLNQFAAREGFALAEIFVEQDVNQPCAALVALIETARRCGVVAVAVPSLNDLGRLPRVQYLTRARLEREAGVRVLVAAVTS
jgi:hypothetical protein